MVLLKFSQVRIVIFRAIRMVGFCSWAFIPSFCRIWDFIGNFPLLSVPSLLGYCNQSFFLVVSDVLVILFLFYLEFIIVFVIFLFHLKLNEFIIVFVIFILNLININCHF